MTKDHPYYTYHSLILTHDKYVHDIAKKQYLVYSHDSGFKLNKYATLEEAQAGYATVPA